MEPKWQRISFMPATPLGEDGRRANRQRGAHCAIPRAAAEGMVLLKTKNETLPLKRGSRVAVLARHRRTMSRAAAEAETRRWFMVRSLAQGLRMKQDEGENRGF